MCVSYAFTIVPATYEENNVGPRITWWSRDIMACMNKEKKIVIEKIKKADKMEWCREIEKKKSSTKRKMKRIQRIEEKT